MLATEKQIKFIKSLIGQLEKKLKREYAYYNSENSTVVALMNAFKSDIKHEKEITKISASQGIQIFLDALNK